MNALTCPACRIGLLKPSDEFKCPQCLRTFQVHDGIPHLFLPEGDGVTATVKNFYEQNPFPNYDGADTIARLYEKARQGFFAKLLNEQIPPKARILEAGCGTGQLTNFLALSPVREVWGTDISLASLRLAETFRAANNIDSAKFVQMNLFHPVFPDEAFDYIISNGVLHHTRDPYLAFQSILRLVRPGGYIIIGLYNRYGRLWNDAKRLFFRLIDREKSGSAKERAWFADQYQHPQESKHTFGEVLGWFRENNVEFVSSVPKAEVFAEFDKQERLFLKQPKGIVLDHFLVQFQMMFVPKEGGLFIMIGKKR